MVIKRRAINDEQKSERRQAIMDKAWELLQDSSYETINILDVAQKAGLAKGTVYVYFPTKEALFLAILEQQFGDWFDEIDQALNVVATLSETELIKLFTASLASKPTLSRLFSIAHVVLEHNIDYETAKSYKHMLLERVFGTGQLLEKHLSFLKSGQGAQFLLRAYSLVIGVENLAHPARIVQEVLQSEAELGIFVVDFSFEFSEMLRALLNYYKR